ncbi:MAG: hypothetical protein KatS3mg052_2742 [Candidatus Roseilinea sp.]|nr:MAG: hypothetical protein KatS3mg052_2742 [Candidatus Roseilinea sp.]
MPTVVLIGTFDTKGAEFDFVRKRIQQHGAEVILVDAGVLGAPQIKPTIPREEVARAAGAEIRALATSGDRGAAVMTMARGAAEIAQRLYAEQKLDGIMGMGGSGNSSIAAAAMRALPVGVPKLIVSTLASGDTRPYVGANDVTLMYSVVDIAGINRVSERILSNAAAAIAGMAAAYAKRKRASKSKPLIGATMFGVTTPCVNAARAWLEERGYEVLVFHATGTGGQSMEALVKGGFLAGVLDITTTELADELVGGVLSAGPERLEAAGRLGVPQVVSLGALDMVNFGPRDTVPEQFRGRNLYQHNAAVTLMRTTAEECAELGRIIARKLNMARGPTAVFIPLKGVSMIATQGKPFYDPEADAALIRELKANLRADIPVREMDTDINDPQFAQAMARELDRMIAGAKDRKKRKK